MLFSEFYHIKDGWAFGRAIRCNLFLSHFDSAQCDKKRIFTAIPNAKPDILQTTRNTHYSIRLTQYAIRITQYSKFTSSSPQPNKR